VIDFPKPGQSDQRLAGGIFDKMYALAIDQNDGVSHWYGHGLAANGSRIEEVYNADRVLPRAVKVKEHYMVGETQNEVSKQIEVKRFGW
jgi:hypothetical protein